MKKAPAGKKEGPIHGSAWGAFSEEEDQEDLCSMNSQRNIESRRGEWEAGIIRSRRTYRMTTTTKPLQGSRVQVVEEPPRPGPAGKTSSAPSSLGSTQS